MLNSAKMPPMGGAIRIACQKQRGVVLNERASDETYFDVFPIRGSEMGAADCGLSQQITGVLDATSPAQP